MNPNPLTVVIDEGGIWHQAYFFVLAAAIVLVAYRKKMPWEPRVLWAYVTIQALYTVEYPTIRYAWNTAYQATAGQTLAELILIPALVFSARALLWKLLPYVTTYTLACVWLQCDGLLVAPSFNSAMAALAVPFLPWYLALATIVTVVTHHGSTAVLVLAAEFAVFFRRHWKWYPLALIPLGYAAYVNSGHMFDGSERLQRWIVYMKDWWSYGASTILFGRGPGAFTWDSFILYKWEAPFFFQMHSDFLQIWRDLGIAGGILVWCMLIKAVRIAWQKPKLLSGLCGIMAFSLTYHPTRFAPSAILAAMILERIFNNGKQSNQVVRNSPPPSNPVALKKFASHPRRQAENKSVQTSRQE